MIFKVKNYFKYLIIIYIYIKLLLLYLQLIQEPTSKNTYNQLLRNLQLSFDNLDRDGLYKFLI